MAVGNKLRFTVLTRDGFKCQYCGATPGKQKLEVDHVHPRCEGGADTLSNLVTACSDCNRGKGRSLINRPATDPVWVIEGGPFGCRIQSFCDKSPLLWVVENCGEMLLFEDAWRIGSHGCRIGKPMKGHPKAWSKSYIFNSEQGFDHTTRIVGFYWQHRASEIMDQLKLTYFSPADYLDEIYP